MSTISFAGVGSGLPVQDIVKASVQAQSGPLTKLQNDKAYASAQISAYGQISSRLNSLREAMLELRGLDKFQTLAATSGNDKLFTAKADHLAGATNGNYSIQVLAEARHYQQTSAVYSSSSKIAEEGQDAKLVFSGLKNSDGSALANVDLDVAGKTLDEVRQMINSHDDLKGKVSANLVNVGNGEARLVLKSETTGEEGRFTAEFSGADLPQVPVDPDEPEGSLTALTAKDAGLSSTSASLDARIKIDGIDVSSSTNTFSNVISGVDITLAAGAASETNKTSSLKVARDDEKILDSVNAFVKAYNDVIINLNEQKKNGMAGDSTLRSIEQEMRNVLMTPTEEGGPVLAQLGIKTFVEKSYNPEDGASSRNGTLEIDNEALKKAMDEDFDLFARTFGSSNFYDETQPSGYAERFADLAQRLTTTTVQDGRISKGLLEIRTDGLKDQVKRYDDRIESTNMRLQLLEERLYAQFSSIEGLVANMNSTQGYLVQQMNQLPGYTR